jgi:hypothetical protein
MVSLSNHEPAGAWPGENKKSAGFADSSFVGLRMRVV